MNIVENLGEVSPDYIKKVTNYCTLGIKETNRLIEQYQSGNTEAGDKVILHNLKLVLKVVQEFGILPNDERFEYFVTTGNLGLVHAVKTFNSDLDGMFSDYAVHWIKNSILQSLESHESLVLPEFMYSAISNYKRLVAQTIFELGRTLTQSELMTCAILASVKKPEYQNFILELFYTDMEGMDIPEYFRVVEDITGDKYRLKRLSSLDDVRDSILGKYMHLSALEYIISSNNYFSDAFTGDPYCDSEDQTCGQCIYALATDKDVEEEAINHVLLDTFLEDVQSILDTFEFELLKYNFGLGVPVFCNEEVAIIYGITPSEVARIQNDAILKLRNSTKLRHYSVLLGTPLL